MLMQQLLFSCFQGHFRNVSKHKAPGIGAAATNPPMVFLPPFTSSGVMVIILRGLKLYTVLALGRNLFQLRNLLRSRWRRCGARSTIFCLSHLFCSGTSVATYRYVGNGDGELLKGRQKNVLFGSIVWP